MDFFTRIPDIVEYLTEYEGAVTVKQVMLRFEITKEQYDFCMLVAMPAIRRKNELRAARNMAAELKRQLDAAKARIKQLEGVKQ